MRPSSAEARAISTVISNCFTPMGFEIVLAILAASAILILPPSGWAKTVVYSSTDCSCETWTVMLNACESCKLSSKSAIDVVARIIKRRPGVGGGFRSKIISVWRTELEKFGPTGVYSLIRNDHFRLWQSKSLLTTNLQYALNIID